MLWPTGVVVLVFLNYARCSFLSDLIRVRRATNETDFDNTIIEVFNDCKCVYYYQCDANNNVITNGETLINVRNSNNLTRIPCKGAFEGEMVCCKLNNSTSSLTLGLKSPDEGAPVTEIVDEGNETNATKEPKKILCGAQRTTINVRIFAGEDELTPMAGEFPWIVAIFKKTSSDGYTFHCSGSLIHPKVVLTANHCVHRKKADAFKVILNGQIILASIGGNVNDERQVSEIVHHADYYAGALFNDIAMLILDQPYVSSKENSINTLCLPPSDVNLDNQKCLVAGWGKDNAGQSKTVMKKVELPYVGFDRCQDLLRKTRLGKHFILHQSFMCAGGEAGKDACKGDGGSPLMCQLPSDSRYFQMGIVSWGIGCGVADVPGVYGNVQVFGDWIRRELGSRGLNL